MAFATPGDVAVELGRQTPAEDSVEYKQWDKWLHRAERQIRQRIPLLDEWCTDDAYRALVADVESAAVARKALNPEGIRSVMTQIDDANMQKTIDTSRSGGEVNILDSEWALLLRIPASEIETATIMPDEPVSVHPPRRPTWW